MADETALLQQLNLQMPLKLQPLTLPAGMKVGLVVVDEVNGFCTVGMGNLAPQAPNKQISEMVEETNRLAQEFTARNWPIMMFLDTHEPDRPEPPYPPHCVRGTGEELLVPALEWLGKEPLATLMTKDCINGFIGGIREDGSNIVVDWVVKNQLEAIVTVGICTDICVMDFVLTALSARNHGMLGTLRDVYVYSRGCSTYTLPRQVAEAVGLGPHAAHPQEATHHMGLYFMHSRGAALVDALTFENI